MTIKTIIESLDDLKCINHTMYLGLSIEAYEEQADNSILKNPKAFTCIRDWKKLKK